LAYENDTGYEEVVREAEYLNLLNLFRSPTEFKKFLSNMPLPKGNSSFFLKKYGKVDGREHFKIANLRHWPLCSNHQEPNPQNSQNSSSSTDREQVEQKISAVMTAWLQILKDSNNSEDALDVLGMPIVAKQNA